MSQQIQIQERTEKEQAPLMSNKAKQTMVIKGTKNCKVPNLTQGKKHKNRKLRLKI